MYAMQLGSLFRAFSSLDEMLTVFKKLPWVQQTCCTLFDYSAKKYAEGGTFGTTKKLNWQDMP